MSWFKVDDKLHSHNSGCERPHEELRAWLDRERRHEGTP